MSAGIPYIDASWSIPLPAQPPIGPRSEQNARGIGDISAIGRYWIRDTASHPRGNFAVGLGVKAPTGRYDVKDNYPVLNGTNPTLKAVDMSIQPGDGGWGVIFDFQGFKRIGKTVVLGNATYLANLRDTNGTPSIISGLGLGAIPAFANRLVNTVPDQYIARLGAAYPIGRSGLFAGAWVRAEGVPRYDLIGESHGFRRPGYEIFFEPNLAYTRGADTWSLSVPLAHFRKRVTDPYTDFEGDATFPDSILLFGYAHRFQSGKGALPEARNRPAARAECAAAPASPAAGR